MTNNREKWGSHVGFIFAAIGAAVGIGNIWRFPYIVGTSGGGAFLVTYLIIIFTFGLSFMILELAVGRYYQTSVITSLINIRKKFKWLGVAMVGVAFAILSYYLVILGWILSYFLLMLLGLPIAFDTFADSPYPVLAFLTVLGINYVIIRSGVTRGIERLNKIGVLLLIGLMIPLTILGVLLPGSDKGIDFYLMPDFSKLSDPTVWSIAFGQAFFSLSIGTGILLTYGSYLREKRSLVKSSVVIIVADLIIALMAGLMIFSIVFAFGMDPAQGTSLVFRAMPSIFANMQFGMIVGALFFFLLLIAGLTSSVSMFQLPVASLEDSLGFKRHKSALIIVIL
ncbi:MAG: sodium-dependent transporter, partial [Nitrososphaerales archaeon]